MTGDRTTTSVAAFSRAPAPASESSSPSSPSSPPSPAAASESSAVAAEAAEAAEAGAGAGAAEAVFGNVAAALADVPSLQPLWSELRADVERMRALGTPTEAFRAAVASNVVHYVRRLALAPAHASPLAALGIDARDVITLYAHGCRQHPRASDENAPSGEILALVIHDDAVTSHDFVAAVLRDRVGVPAAFAEQHMAAMQLSGSAVVAVLPRQHAIAMVNDVHAFAREHAMPLKLSLARHR